MSLDYWEGALSDVEDTIPAALQGGWWVVGVGCWVVGVGWWVAGGSSSSPSTLSEGCGWAPS